MWSRYVDTLCIPKVCASASGSSPEGVPGRCRKLPAKIGDALTPQQYKEAKELGILVDKDDQANTTR